jgi:ketosteroid isomerase-like protein
MTTRKTASTATKRTRTTTTEQGAGGDPAEILRRGLRAWSEGDDEDFLATLHPDIEWHTIGSFPGLQPVYRGREGVMELRRLMLEAFERIEITPVRIVVDGERVHAHCQWYSRGKGSGADVQFATIEHLDLEQGMCIRRTGEQPTPEALARYGLAG